MGVYVGPCFLMGYLDDQRRVAVCKTNRTAVSCSFGQSLILGCEIITTANHFVLNVLSDDKKYILSLVQIRDLMPSNNGLLLTTVINQVEKRPSSIS
jgi:hypothetical protein